jgi:hypothetical protein
LQRLLADHPAVIAGAQINPTDPRRWLLVAREMPVPGEMDGGWRWSLDYLLLDQDGVPTLVEVKRSTDTRLRREVVGKLLDYAANAVAYWPVEEIRSRFEQRCEAAARDPAAELNGLLDAGADAEHFWSKVKTNLQAGKIRLIFVADAIPPELSPIIEFLNLQMDPAEVLGLEIKQYAGEGMQLLVPRVVGQLTKDLPPVREGRLWDERSFFEIFEERNGAEIARVARRIFEWAVSKGAVAFGRGKQDGSFGVIMRVGSTRRYIFQIWVSGMISMNFGYIRDIPPFDEPTKRLDLLSLSLHVRVACRRRA